ncbi:phosphate-binding protein [Streptomyces nigrescens]|uniref:Phosphate-binding protein n=1 Tax=Streptomyces nigrescens TaxID=1920 RepID=A0ABM7ZLU3_STRNI|nr:substrate-binding domain-containing protein [Streptomyces nigrescens]BDM67357.1 phosphate-binding protein [Streptomyces nigrescens]
MALPDTETILTAAGLVATAVVWAVERFLPGRKRIGYRVQMDTAIGMNPQDAHSLVQLRLLRQDQEVNEATLALLRFENDGGKDIVRQDYQEPLTVEFAGRTVIGVEVPDAHPTDLVGMLTRNGGGLRHDGGRLFIPKVPLNKRNHFKLLVLLSATDTRTGADPGTDPGPDAGTDAGSGSGTSGTPGTTGNSSRTGSAPGTGAGAVTVSGFISGGRIRRNAQRWGPRKLSLALGGTFIVLLGLLGGLLLSARTAPTAAGECATGRLTIDGSTAFAPPMREIARQYRARCAGAEITVSASGSLSGLGSLNREGKPATVEGPGFLAVSDVPAPSLYRRLEGDRIGVILLGLVANEKAGVDDLTSAQVRKIYDGTYTNWKQLHGNDLPIRLVSRDASSGTRRAFETSVLHHSEPGVVSSYDCGDKDRDEQARLTRCEVDSTKSLLDAVDRVPGAVGYAEVYAAAQRQHVVSVRLNGHEPDIEWGQQRDYPFWTVEYLYTYGRPEDGSLTAKFLAFMDSDTAKNIMRMYKHVPCADRQSLPDAICRP